MPCTTTIGLWNVKGVHPTQNYKAKLPLLMEWAKTSGCPLVALTETHTTSDFNPFLNPFFLKYHSVATASADSKAAGVALVSLDPNLTVTRKVSGLQGRLLVAEVSGPSLGQPLLVAVVYAPDSSKGDPAMARFFNQCWPLIPKEVDLLLGDFNVTIRPQDSSRGFSRHPQPAAALKSLVDHLGLVDVAPEEASHTFKTFRHGSVFSTARLDRVYARLDSPWAPQHMATLDPMVSDHAPVRVSLLTNSQPKASPVWRLNMSSASPTLKLALSDLVEDLPESPTIKQWDAFKKQVKALSIQFQRAERKQAPSSRPEPTVEFLEAKLAADSKAARIPIDLARELPSSYLTSWVKGARARTVITQLRKAIADPPQTDQRAIMAILEEYWSSLFTLRPISPVGLQALLRVRSWNSLAKKVSQEELEAAIKKAKSSSSPGPDGLPYEFYKAFPALWPKMLSLFNHCYLDAIVPHSWKEALLRPLPKEGKDPSIVSNYRPIALMCTDYKLLAAILAARLQREVTASNYFTDHQTGFVAGKSIYSAIIKVASWSLDSNLTTSLLDFEKAYDRVQHAWLFTCLKSAGLPAVFINFLQAAFKGSTIMIIANGMLSARLKVSSGVRQGDPLSPLLFNFAIEPLLLSLAKKNIKVQGHADDTALAVTNTTQATTALELLGQYEQASGMLLNRSKSVVLAPSSSPVAKALGFSSKPYGDRYLGIHLTALQGISILPGTWETLKARLDSLSKLPLSTFGKMSILRSYIRPVVLFQLLVAPMEDIKEWMEAEKKFLSPNSSTPRAIVAEKRLHPLNWARLPPLVWEVDCRRISWALKHGPSLRTTPQELKHPWPMGLIHQGRRSPLFPMHLSLVRRASLLEIPVVDIYGQGPTLKVNIFHPLIWDNPPPVKTTLQEKLLALPLVLTRTQEKWTKDFGTDWRKLWTAFPRFTKKLRSPVASFLWRLLNVNIPWPSHQHCPLCNSQEKSSAHHLFLDCPALQGAYTTQPLVTLLPLPIGPTVWKEGLIFYIQLP